MNFCKPFKLFASCLLVKGYSRSILVDTQRNEIHFIPNEIYNILFNTDIQIIDQILTNYNEADRDSVISIFQYLYDNELIFFTDYPDKFPSINTNFDFPSHVTNFILVFNRKLLSHYDKLILSLDNLLCFALEIRITREVSIEVLDKFISKFRFSTIQSILIRITDYNYDYEKLVNLANKFPRVYCIELFSFKDKDSFKLNSEVAVINQVLNNKCCGKIGEQFFATTLENSLESLKYNSCLYKKMSIDFNGNIKNCPSMKESYGNMKNTTLAEAIEKPGFKKYWNINKDKIHVCKDCEFRYICTDCRAYVEDPDDILSKPLKCGYNPYTGEWSEWSTNPLKQKAIDFYDMRKMVEEMDVSDSDAT